MVTVVPVWVDTDGAHDDALGLLLACALPYFELLGVSTVYGTTSVDGATRNAMSLLGAFQASLEVQVFPGAEKPLYGLTPAPPPTAGVSGLDGSSLLPLSVVPRQPDHTAVGALAEAIQQHPGQICVVCLGPLTNMALLASNYPDLMAHINMVSVSCGPADSNLTADKRAAQIVLSCPELSGRVVLVPPTASDQLLATPRVLRQIQRGIHLDRYTVFRQMMYELLTWYCDAAVDSDDYVKTPSTDPKSPEAGDEAVPMRDPVAVAALLPHLGVNNAGIDIRSTRNGHSVVARVEASQVWQLIFTAIEALEA